MVTKTILATAARLKSNVSTAKRAHPPDPAIAAQSKDKLTTQPSSSTSSSTTATTTILPPVASSATLQHQRPTCSQTSRTSQTLSQPVTGTTDSQCRSASGPSQTPVGSIASPQTQSCSTSLTSVSLQPPNKSPQTQLGPPISASASASPQLPNTNPPSLQAQSLSSTLASAPPQPPNASTVSSQTQPCVSNPGTATPQPPTASNQTQLCLPTSATTSNQTPTTTTVSSHAQSCSRIPTSATTQLQTPTQSSPLCPASAPSGLSTPASVSRNAAPKLTTKLGKWTSSAIGLAAMVATVYYGSTTLDYARWTKHNDFREGCINDRDHDLPLSAECVAELRLPRVSAVKRQIEALQDACVANALYWTVAICIPALTCLFYLVWRRTHARDGPRPMISLLKMDISNCGQGHHENGSSTTTQIDEDLYDLSDVREDKVYDHQQQAAMNVTPSEPASDEDYFQAWRDRMKSPQKD
jgi:hypothetical protein